MTPIPDLRFLGACSDDAGLRPHSEAKVPGSEARAPFCPLIPTIALERRGNGNVRIAMDNGPGHRHSDSTCVAKAGQPRWANGAAA